MITIPPLDHDAIVAEYEARKADTLKSEAGLERALAARSSLGVRAIFDTLQPERAEQLFFELAEAKRLYVSDELTVRYVAARFGDRILPDLEEWAHRGCPELLASWGSRRAAVFIFRRRDSEDPVEAARAAEWVEANEAQACDAAIRLAAHSVTAREWLAERPAMTAAALGPIAFHGDEDDRRLGIQTLSWFVERFGRESIGAISAEDAARIDEAAERNLRSVDAPFRPTKWWPLGLRGADQALLEEALKARHPRRVEQRAALGDDALALAHEIIDAFVADKAKPANRWSLALALGLAPDAAAKRLSRLVWTWAKSKNRNHRNLVSHVFRFLGDSRSEEAIARLVICAEGMAKPAHRESATLALRSIAVDEGVSVEELKEKATPDLGLEADGSLLLDYGPRRFRVRFTGKGAIVADEKGKARAKLPKPGKKDDAAKAAAAYARYVETRDDYKHIVRSRSRQLERALHDQRRWTHDAFGGMVASPVMRSLLGGLVFAHEGGSFRVSVEGEFRNSEDESATPEGDVWLVHPLDLEKESQERWRQVFVDYELVGVFPQLDRKTFDVADPEKALGHCEGWQLHPGAIMGLLGEGWSGEWRSGGVLKGLSYPVESGRLVVSFEPFSTSEIRQAGPTAIDALRPSPGAVVDPIRLSELLRDLDGARSGASAF